jgi:steroid 5-alpha reductase family enzyme
MERSDRSALLAIPLAIIAALLVAWAGSQGGTTWMGVPAFVLLVAIAFLLQWLAFIPAYIWQTEKFFDITGSASYVIVAGLALALGPALDARSVLLFVLVVIWATRLGTFLLRRVHRTGKDARFDDIKPSIPRFLMTWTLQGLWISLTLAAALVAMTTSVQSPLGTVSYIGLGLWMLGIAIEALADMQKSRFRSDSANKGTFIHTGLWRWSRHPNYFGEIVLWIGMAVIASPVLLGWQWITLISPIFVVLLLTRVSGIPMLERRSDEKWGGQDSYEAYKRRTSILVLWPPKKLRD